MDLGMELDNALRYLGSLSRYSRLYFSHILIFTSGIPAAMTMMMVFIVSDPASHFCTPSPEGFYVNTTSGSNNGNTTQDFDEGCQVYEVRDGIVTPNITSCQYGWEYSYTYGEKSIVSEFDLVCDRRLLKDTATTVFMAGLMVGALPMGQMCDRFGRKIVTFLSLLLLGASGLGMAFSYSYYVFVIMWFLVGVFRQGTMVGGFILLIEMLPPETRALGGLAANLGWGVGVVLLALLGFGLRHWRHLQILLSLGILVALPFYCIINESVRWLISQRRYDEAEILLQKVATFNRIVPPSKFLQTSESEGLEKLTSSINGTKESRNNEDLITGEDPDHKLQYSNLNEAVDGRKDHVNLTVFDLFKTPNLAKNTLILSLDWIAGATTYYGLSLNSTNLAGNMYLNFFLLSLVEIPAYILAFFSMEYFGGRKYTTGLSVLIAGIACVITAWIPKQTASGTDLTTAITTFAMIGKFAISYTWGGIVVYTPELFPTGVRSVANGLCSSVSRIGGMLAPFIVRLNEVSPYLPLNIFGIISIIAGLLTFLLPETRNVPLPETLEEGEMLGKSKESGSTKSQNKN